MMSTPNGATTRHPTDHPKAHHPKAHFGIPRTCRTAPVVLLRVEDVPRTSLSAGPRRATLIRQAAPSSRAKATIGQVRGAWGLTGEWVLARSKSEGAHCSHSHRAYILK